MAKIVFKSYTEKQAFRFRYFSFRDLVDKIYNRSILDFMQDSLTNNF